MRVVFMGTPRLAVPTLEALIRQHRVVGVVTRPDRPQGRGKRVEVSPVKEHALAAGVPVLQPARLSQRADLDDLAALDPDVIVVVAYGVILPAGVLRLPRLGCVNLHASLLPRHRGASPIQATILAGDSVAGVTAMLMDAGLDTGPILRQREVAVTGADTSATLGERLGLEGAELILEVLDGLAAGQIEPVPQDESLATVTGLVRKADGRVDWTADVASIERHVRAMQPWPGAWTEYNGQRLMIWRVEPVPGCVSGPAGRVFGGAHELRVAAGDGDVRVLELQRPGGRRLAAADFLRGARDLVGSMLGEGE